MVRTKACYGSKQLELAQFLWLCNWNLKGFAYSPSCASFTASLFVLQGFQKDQGLLCTCGDAPRFALRCSHVKPRRLSARTSAAQDKTAVVNPQQCFGQSLLLLCKQQQNNCMANGTWSSLESYKEGNSTALLHVALVLMPLLEPREHSVGHNKAFCSSSLCTNIPRAGGSSVHPSLLLSHTIRHTFALWGHPSLHSELCTEADTDSPLPSIEIGARNSPSNRGKAVPEGAAHTTGPAEQSS